jgi:hypothetical protein
MPNNVDAFLYLVTAIGAFSGTLLGVGALLAPLFRSMKKAQTRLDNFFRDWDGTPAEPGRDRVPGVMERINRLDGELSRNGGKSVKDTVNRIEKRLIDGDKKFDDLYSRVNALEDTL